MKKNIHLLVFTCILFCMGIMTSVKSHALHMVGGEIQYKCLGENRYEFTVILYQNCLPGTEGPIEADNPLYYAIYNGSTQFDYNQINTFSFEIISRDFESDCLTEVPPMCLRKSIFKTVVTLPPSELPYTFVYQRCCRNPGILNLVNSGNLGVTYYATVPPTMGSECINNSPVFKNEPPQIICSTFPFMYDYSATDVDGDSLVYRLVPSYRGASLEVPIPSGTLISGPPFTSANYSPGFSYLNPINGIPPVSINAETGLLTLTPVTNGRYQLTVGIDEYRGGALINTHSRDLQLIVANCKKVTFADMPTIAGFENTYDIVCDGYTVDFVNTSSGNLNTFHWDFGDGSSLSTEANPTHTYTDTGIYEVKLIVNKDQDCPDSLVRYVRVYPYLTGEYEHTGVQCVGEVIRFSDTVYNTHIGLPYTVEYDFGDGNTYEGRNPSHTYIAAGEYQVTMSVKNELGCNTQFIKVIEIQDPEAFAGNDTFVVKDYGFHLQASGGDYYEWFPKDILVDPYNERTYVNFPDTGTYEFIVKVTTEYGCTDFDTVRVSVVENASILLPNAFSPNGDGLNDVIFPSLVGYLHVNYFRIYDRWGNLVFVSYKNGVGWDGTFKGVASPTGVYFYELSVQDIFYKNHIQKGDITLIR